MNITDIIKMECVKQHISITELANKINTSKQNLNNKLTRNDLKFSDIEKIFKVLNLEIKIINQSGMEYK